MCSCKIILKILNIKCLITKRSELFHTLPELILVGHWTLSRPPFPRVHYALSPLSMNRYVVQLKVSNTSIFIYWSTNLSIYWSCRTIVSDIRRPANYSCRCHQEPQNDEQMNADFSYIFATLTYRHGETYFPSSSVLEWSLDVARDANKTNVVTK
jgi:hypothetical protein